MFNVSSTVKIAAAVALVCSLLVAGGGLAFWRGMAAIERMAEAAATSAREERDAHYKAEIAASNARVAEERAQAAINASAESARAEGEIARLRSTITDLEAQNAALPASPGRGIGHDRVRLLNRSAPAAPR